MPQDPRLIQVVGHHFRTEIGHEGTYHICGFIPQIHQGFIRVCFTGGWGSPEVSGFITKL